MSDFTKRRLKDFHEALKPRCHTEKSFHDSFLVRRNHLVKSAEKDPNMIRLNLGDEQIAAVIATGQLNEDQSRMNGTLPEIALEGKFRDFPWTELDTTGGDKAVDHIEPLVVVRVVVRQGARKHIVVTAYRPWREIINPDLLPEVTYDFW
jgi:hypothetical protein